FWSIGEHLITVAGAAADLTFPIIGVSRLPSGLTIAQVDLMLIIRAIQDTSGADNYIDQVSKTLRVMKAGGTWGSDDVVGLTFDQDALYCVASTKEFGPAIVGSHDIRAVVDGNGTYNVRSEESNRGDAISALADNILLRDVQVGFRVYFS
ncbi:unnamed protein product, partial [marine sediment metagenome]